MGVREAGLGSMRRQGVKLFREAAEKLRRLPVAGISTNGANPTHINLSSLVRRAEFSGGRLDLYDQNGSVASSLWLRKDGQQAAASIGNCRPSSCTLDHVYPSIVPQDLKEGSFGSGNPLSWSLRTGSSSRVIASTSLDFGSADDDFENLLLRGLGDSLRVSEKIGVSPIVKNMAYSCAGSSAPPGCSSAEPMFLDSVKRKRRKKMNKHKEKKRRRRDKSKR